MSEFTDFFAVLTEAHSLTALRAELVRSVSAADVPLDELGVDFTQGQDIVEQAWAKYPKPAWVRLWIDGSLADLAQIGPALHVQVEEDFASWSLEVHCAGATFDYAFLAEGRDYRGVTDDSPLYSAATPPATLDAVSGCLGLERPTFEAALIPDGGERFLQAIGLPYEQMLDLTQFDMEPGEVTLAYLY